MPRVPEAYKPTGPSEGPSVEDLKIADDEISTAGAAKCLHLTQRAEQVRISLVQSLDDAFEHLVTQGDADGYHPMIERFKPKFSTMTDNLERIIARLASLSQPALANVVKQVAAKGQSRLDAKLEEQVLRQRLSITDLEDEERPTLKAKLGKVTEGLKGQDAAVEELLEELRAELADLDDDE